jgi:UDP-glucose 4-epimerase
MKKVLITGANSYIGCSFEAYVKEYYPEVFSVDVVEMIDGTWRAKDFSKYDVIFHLAGLAHADVGNVSDEVKSKYYKVNTELAIETAQKAKAEGVKQFVFMSSMIVYGGLERITKETVPQPANFYGDSKWQADKGIRALQDENFCVSVLRPPMIYGKGSKGNYPVLAKLAKKLPVFPKVNNKRSMLYIENLCEFLCVIMKDTRAGIFFPQNKELVNTSDMVKQIAAVNGHKIWVTFLLTPFVMIGRKVPGKIGDLCRKAFGSSYYELEMSECGFEYCAVSMKDSICKTEG